MLRASFMVGELCLMLCAARGCSWAKKWPDSHSLSGPLPGRVGLVLRLSRWTLGWIWSAPWHGLPIRRPGASGRIPKTA